jgi:hypothetical protein
VLYVSNSDEDTEFWALDPVAQRWRQFADLDALRWVAAGDVLFTFTAAEVHAEGFVAHR